MKKKLVVLLAAILTMAGCLGDLPAPAFQVTLRLSPTPVLIGPTRLIIDVMDAGGDPIENAAVSVEGLPEEPNGRRATTGLECWSRRSGACGTTT